MFGYFEIWSDITTMLVQFHLQMTVYSAEVITFYVYNLYRHNVNIALSVFLKFYLNCQTLCLIKVIVDRTFAKNGQKMFDV